MMLFALKNIKMIVLLLGEALARPETTSVVLLVISALPVVSLGLPLKHADIAESAHAPMH